MSISITSDRDYLELVQSDDILISASGGSDSDFTQPSTVYAGSNYGVTTITHGLGQIPFVRAFYDPAKNGRYYNTKKLNGSSFQSWDNPWLMTVSTATTTKLCIASTGTSTDIPVHYRIYRFNASKSVTSDERIDKIFTEDESSATLSAAGSSISPQTTTQTIPHGQAASVLNTLQFSTNGTTWYSAGAYIFNGFDTGSGPPGGPYAFYYYTTALASADNTNLYIYYEHNNASQTTIFVRYALDLRI